MNIKKNPLSAEHWSWIKYRLVLKGFPTFVSLSEKYGYSTSSFKIVKLYAFPSIEKIMADIIGMTPKDLFPNRYTSDGKPFGRNYPRDGRLAERKIICNGKDKEGICHETQFRR